MPETMYDVKETGKWLRSPHLKGVNRSIDSCNFNMLYNVNVTLNKFLCEKCLLFGVYKYLIYRICIAAQFVTCYFAKLQK